MQYDKLNNVGEKRYARNDKLRYTVLAKKTFLVTEDGLVNFKIKGACDVDQDFKEVLYNLLILWNLMLKLVQCWIFYFFL